MIEWWTTLPVYQADVIVIIGGMGVLGLYAAVANWWENRQN